MATCPARCAAVQSQVRRSATDGVLLFFLETQTAWSSEKNSWVFFVHLIFLLCRSHVWPPNLSLRICGIQFFLWHGLAGGAALEDLGMTVATGPWVDSRVHIQDRICKWYFNNVYIYTHANTHTHMYINTILYIWYLYPIWVSKHLSQLL